jgi:hypothetical protein
MSSLVYRLPEKAQVVQPFTVLEVESGGGFGDDFCTAGFVMPLP